jgi:sec-independent protein translocase protein TatA
MPSIGPEWIVVLVVIILLFGAKKLPELARSVGKSTSEFKKGMKDGATDADTDEAGASEPTARDKADASSPPEPTAQDKADNSSASE